MATISVLRRVTTCSGSTTRRRGLLAWRGTSADRAIPPAVPPCSAFDATLDNGGSASSHSSSSLSTPTTATSSGTCSPPSGRLRALPDRGSRHRPSVRSAWEVRLNQRRQMPLFLFPAPFLLRAWLIRRALSARAG